VQRCTHPRITGVGALADPVDRCDARLAMREVSGERVGSALRRLAEDLVAARRQVALLERENRELRAQIQALERTLREREWESLGPPAAA
jgi:hypothetical protein